MPGKPDDGVFIRSLAAAAGRGAVAEYLDVMVRLLEAFGFDVVLIETAGAGQGDTSVRALADVVVLLLQPETGDDLQWEKAGLLEVADIVVIHKADLPGADNLEAQVRATLGLSAGRAVPVLRVSAKDGRGIDELWTAISACPCCRPARPGVEVLRFAQERLGAAFAQARAAEEPRLKELLVSYEKGLLTLRQASDQLLQLLAKTAP
jgi:putative protein kinase ArgK-like GTPase of G3E family